MSKEAEKIETTFEDRVSNGKDEMFLFKRKIIKITQHTPTQYRTTLSVFFFFLIKQFLLKLFHMNIM